MVTFITGKSGAGKTTLAYAIAIKTKNTIIIDGDDFRSYFKSGYSLKEKEYHIIHMAKIAALIESQGFNVIISAILPTKALREKARSFCKKSFLIYLSGGIMWKNTEYEIPMKDENVLCL